MSGHSQDKSRKAPQVESETSQAEGSQNAQDIYRNDRDGRQGGWNSPNWTVGDYPPWGGAGTWVSTHEQMNEGGPQGVPNVEGRETDAFSEISIGEWNAESATLNALKSAACDEDAEMPKCGMCCGFEEFCYRYYEYFVGDRNEWGIVHSTRIPSIPLCWNVVSVDVVRRDTSQGSELVSFKGDVYYKIRVRVSEEQDPCVTEEVLRRGLSSLNDCSQVDIHKKAQGPCEKCRTAEATASMVSMNEKNTELLLLLNKHVVGSLAANTNLWIRPHKNPGSHQCFYHLMYDLPEYAVSFMSKNNGKIRFCCHIANRLRTRLAEESNDLHPRFNQFDRVADMMGLVFFDDDQISILERVVNHNWSTEMRGQIDYTTVIDAGAGTSKTTTIVACQNAEMLRALDTGANHVCLYIADTHEAVCHAYKKCFDSRRDQILVYQQEEALDEASGSVGNDRAKCSQYLSMQMASRPPLNTFTKCFPLWNKDPNLTLIEDSVKFLEDPEITREITGNTIFCTVGYFAINKRFRKNLAEFMKSGSMTVYIDEAELTSFPYALFPFVYFGGRKNVRFVACGDTKQSNPSKFIQSFMGVSKLTKDLSLLQVLECGAKKGNTWDFEMFERQFMQDMWDFTDNRLAKCSGDNKAAYDICSTYDIPMSGPEMGKLQKILNMFWASQQSLPKKFLLRENYRCPLLGVQLANLHAYKDDHLRTRKVHENVDDLAAEVNLFKESASDQYRNAPRNDENVDDQYEEPAYYAHQVSFFGGSMDNIMELNVISRQKYYSQFSDCANSPLLERRGSGRLGTINLAIVHGDAALSDGSVFGSYGSMSFPETIGVVRVALEMASKMPIEPLDSKRGSLVIVSPNRSQCSLIRTALDLVKKGCPQAWNLENIHISTVFSFTGKESSRVIYSPGILSQTSGTYSDNANLVNVATTREKHQLVIVLNGSVFGLLNRDHQFHGLLRALGNLPDLTVVEGLQESYLPSISDLDTDNGERRHFQTLTNIRLRNYADLLNLMSQHRSCSFYGASTKQRPPPEELMQVCSNEEYKNPTESNQFSSEEERRNDAYAVVYRVDL